MSSEQEAWAYIQSSIKTYEHLLFIFVEHGTAAFAQTGLMGSCTERDFHPISTLLSVCL